MVLRLANKMTLVRFSDMHVHFRRNELLDAVVPASAKYCYYVVPMPNAGVYTAQDVIDYEAEIKTAPGGVELSPVMSIYITPKTTAQDIFDAWDAGARNGKIYPKGLTTNSEDGVEDYYALKPVYAAMQKCGMALSLHGERPGAIIMSLDREAKFLPIVRWIHKHYRKLHIVLEHVTTKAAVECVKSLGPTVAATITLHHLLTWFNDVAEPKFHPHLFCKPIAKRYTDMMALVEAALSGNPKFFLGSDTAPHLRSTKECADCCAGVYTAEVLPGLLTHFYANLGAISRLPNFGSFFGPRFYGLPRPEATFTIENERWQVPDLYPVKGHPNDGLVSFHAGKWIDWQVVD